MNCMQRAQHVVLRIEISGWTPARNPATVLTKYLHETADILWIPSTNPRAVVDAILRTARTAGLDPIYTGNGRIEDATSFGIKFARDRWNEVTASVLIANVVDQVNLRPELIDTSKKHPTWRRPAIVRH